MGPSAAAACGLRANAACSVPPRLMSPVNRPRPSSIRESSLRGREAPTQVIARLASASARSVRVAASRFR